MSDFSLYFQLGLEHIADLQAYDHLLFVVVLCVAYTFDQWRQVLVLITAFTIGHSISLALATLNYLPVPAAIIELLIPITILLTAIGNILPFLENKFNQYKKVHYGLALFFGLIHGMGFSTYLRQLLDSEESILQPLLAFNTGLEIGQILIVACFALLSAIVLLLFNYPHREWKILISGAAAGISLILISQLQPW